MVLLLPLFCCLASLHLFRTWKKEGNQKWTSSEHWCLNIMRMSRTWKCLLIRSKWLFLSLRLIGTSTHLCQFFLWLVTNIVILLVLHLFILILTLHSQPTVSRWAILILTRFIQLKRWCHLFFLQHQMYLQGLLRRSRATDLLSIRNGCRKKVRSF